MTTRVALTFDAEHPDRSGCPPRNAERILDTLRDGDATATFFVQGRWAEAYPNTARRIAEDGHQVGNHSFYHARMPLLSDVGLRTDVLDAQHAIGSIVGVDPRPWFRCPFGAGHDDDRIGSQLAELGYRNVYWTVQLEDWEPWRTGEAIAADLLERVRRQGEWSVVILHTWPAGTADALPRALDGLRDDGVELVTVAELERLGAELP